MADILSLGASKVYDAAGGYTIPQANIRRALSPDDPTDVEDLGSLPIACALGVTALPAATDEDTGVGPEGVVIGNVGGLNGCCVAAWDTRCAEVAGQLTAGDTCLHGTHADSAKRARVFCKEDLAAIIVGNDLVFTLDRANKAVTITGWGNVIQMTEDSVKLSQGGIDGSPCAFIEIKGGTIYLAGNVILGAGTVPLPVMYGTSLPSTTVAIADA